MTKQLRFNSTVSVSLSKGEEERYDFTVTSEGVYALELLRDDHKKSGHIYSYLYSANDLKSYIAHLDVYGGYAVCTLKPGNYCVIVKCTYDSNKYSLTLRTASHFKEIKPKTNPIIRGKLNLGSRVNYYRFSVKSRDLYDIYVDVNPNNITLPTDYKKTQLRASLYNADDASKTLGYISPDRYWERRSLWHKYLDPGNYIVVVQREKNPSIFAANEYNDYELKVGLPEEFQLNTSISKTIRKNPGHFYQLNLASREYCIFKWTEGMKDIYIWGPNSSTSVSGGKDAIQEVPRTKRICLEPGQYMMRTGAKDGQKSNDYTYELMTPVELKINGEQKTGDINYPGQEENYRFTVKHEDQYVIETKGDTDVVIYLFGPNEPDALLASDNDSGDDKNAKISRNLEPGEYFVCVRHFSSTGKGEYSIEVKVDPVRLEINASPISGFIRASYQEDFYSFMVTEEGDYIVETEGNTDVEAYLYDADDMGNEIAYDNDSGDHTNARISHHLKEKEYIVKVKHPSGGSGHYDIGVRVKPVDLPIDGGTKSGSCTTPHKEDVYEFNIASGGEYIIKAQGKLDPGKYLVKIQPLSTGTGNYAIGVETASGSHSPQGNPGIGGSTEGGKSYKIKSPSGKLLSVKNDLPYHTADVIGSADIGKEGQKWMITKDGILKTHLGSFALDIAPAGHPDKRSVQIKTIDPNSLTQKWTLTNDGKLINKSNGFVLVVSQVKGYPGDFVDAYNQSQLPYLVSHWGISSYESTWQFEEV